MPPLSLPAVCWVALGGAAGSVGRYLLGLWLTAPLSGAAAGIPLATLLVNAVGSLLLGVIAGVWPLGLPTIPSGVPETLPWARLALATGFCGGFTTFSALSHETMTLLSAGRGGRAAVYVFLTLFLGLAAMWCGLRLGTALALRPERPLPLP